MIQYYISEESILKKFHCGYKYSKKSYTCCSKFDDNCIVYIWEVFRLSVVVRIRYFTNNKSISNQVVFTVTLRTFLGVD